MSNGTCNFSPHEFLIGGIRIIIVDPHNDIMPYWFRQFLSSKLQLVVVRIDEHHDMFHCCPALPAKEGRESFQFIARLMPYLQDYSRRLVNEGNFTCPAFHCGILGALYHFRPSENRINAYGRVSGQETIKAPRTREQNLSALCGKDRKRWILWNDDTDSLNGKSISPKASPKPLRVSQSDFQRDLEDCLLPVAVGFDLDGLYGNGDWEAPDKIISRRLAGTRKVLEGVDHPSFICLARSQTPRSYIPANLVDRLQDTALGLIKEIYG